MIFSDNVFPNVGKHGRKPDGGKKEQAVRNVIGGRVKVGIRDFLEGR